MEDTHELYPAWKAWKDAEAVYRAGIEAVLRGETPAVDRDTAIAKLNRTKAAFMVAGGKID